MNRPGRLGIRSILRSVSLNLRKTAREGKLITFLSCNAHCQDGILTTVRQSGAHPSHHPAAHAHHRHHTREDSAAQRHFFTKLSAAEVCPQVYPFARGQHHIVADLRTLQKSPIGTDHRQRTPITPHQFVDTRIRPVEDPKTVGPGSRRKDKIRLTVNQYPLAQEPPPSIMHMLDIAELIAVIEATILNDQWNIVLTVR